VIGNSRIGRNTCIGSATTIFNASVPAMVVINPGSLIGDTSRQIQEITELAETDLLKQSTTNTKQDSSTATKTSNLEENDDLWAEAALESQISTSNTTSVEEEQVEQQLAVSESENNGFEEIKIHPDTNGSENKSNSSSVVGQVYINQLLLTLFPQGKSQGKDNQKNSE
jgi:carbon dioxide concentrating mechanism protein CcmN